MEFLTVDDAKKEADKSNAPHKLVVLQPNGKYRVDLLIFVLPHTMVYQARHEIIVTENIYSRGWE